jgi:antitoxin (DNA-binding transcriptional repressor) of toxin-antitoxin stability system
MTVTVEIADAQGRLAELVALAEAGETVVLLRGDRPAVRFAPVDAQAAAADVAGDILQLRGSGNVKPVTVEEILAWRHEGHRN